MLGNSELKNWSLELPGRDGFLGVGWIEQGAPGTLLTSQATIRCILFCTGKPCGQAAGRNKVARQAGHMTRQAASAVARNQSVGGRRRHDAVLD